MDDDQENQFDDLPLQDSEKEPEFGSSENTNGRLWIKLKIPKSGELSGEESVQDQNSPRGKELSRICNVCNKGFSSGKALGGHMRIHVQANKDLHLKKTPNPKLKKQLNDVSAVAPARGSDCNTTNAGGGGQMNGSTPTCSLCGKNFPSMKSLFGHMRCHPEREWRGIQPPSTAKNSSSSTLSDAVVARKTTDSDHIDSATTTVGSVVDLSVSLSRWSVTAKRGRKSTASTAAAANYGSSLGSDDHIPDAVYNLMMLAQGHGDYNSLRCGLSYKQIADVVSEATNSNSLTNKPEIENKNHASECVAPSKKRRIEASPIGYRRNSPTKKLKIDERGYTDVGNICESLLKKMERGKGKALLESAEFWPTEKPVIMDSVCDDKDCPIPREAHMEESDSKGTDGSIPGEELNHSNKNTGKMMKKKKRRKMKMRDLESVGDVAPPFDQIHWQVPAALDRYKCSTCNKSFSTHQALGGHRSSHNKVVKTYSHTILDESAYVVAKDGTAAEDEFYGNPSTARVDETEECEEAASSRLVVLTPHQCQICNKTFPTGQALGGHKRCHWTGPVEAPSSQVASPGQASHTGRTVFSFDLNQLPAMEDEEGIESAFTHQSEHAAGSGYASSSYNSVI